jgi:polysaccharide biosynthesis protein PslG
VRRLVFTSLLLALLALPASALADASVNINDSGYDDSVSHTTTSAIKLGEKVTWTYNNALPHGVQFDGASSPWCGAGTALTSPCSKDFPVAGRYRYFDPVNCSDYASCPAAFQGLVVVDGPPVASGAAPASGQRGALITFDAGGSSDPDGDALSYQWDFRDGSTASGATAQHAFATAGHYDVLLTVSDSTGNATTTVPIDITVPDSDGDGVNDDSDMCPSQKAATPNGCPLVVSPTPKAIISRTVTANTLGLQGALKSGVAAILNCSDTCTGFFTLTRGGRSVATPVTARMTGPGTKLVTLRFTSAARRALARGSSAKLQLQVVVTDALTRVQTRKTAITLKRVKTYGKLPAIGISDNQAATFTDPNFQVLKLRYARLVSPWNAIFTEPDRLDAWLQAARADHIRPLVSFEHTRGQVCPGKHCKGPTVNQYKRAWKAFHKKYPWVKDISPWNEVNSATQPTGRRPDLAAAYYNVVRASCRGCTIVGADLLDAPNLRRYVAAFLAKAKGNPRVWGLHNYTDTNRFRSRGTSALLQTVRGTVWLTETGGVVRFVTQKGVVALPKSETRAKKAMDYMFRLAEANAARIKRIYVYQWKINNPHDRFDAGIVRPDGKPRPSYNVLALNASIARKR